MGNWGDAIRDAFLKLPPTGSNARDWRPEFVPTDWELTDDSYADGWRSLDVTGPPMYQRVVPHQYLEQITEPEARRRQLLVPGMKAVTE